MIADQLKQQIMQAMKDRDTVAKDILRVALGDLQTQEARTGKMPEDPEAVKIIRKIIKGNEETLAATEDAETRAKLERENEILSALMPQTLSVDQIIEKLAGVADAIREAGNPGQATGVAMKQLKSTGESVEGKDVAQAVQQIRG